MGTIPKLNIKGGEGDVQALNRWADAVNTEFADQKTQIHATAQKTTVVTAAVAALPPPTTPVTDGLIHGDAIWETDSAYVMLRDDFLSVTPQTPVTGTPLQSKEQWYFVSSGSAFLVTPGYAAPGLGGVFLANNATVNNSSFLVLNAFNGSAVPNNTGWALLDLPSWQYEVIFMLQRAGVTVPATQAPTFSMTQVSLYVGLGNWQPDATFVSTQQPRPPVFCGVRFDTDTTAPSIADTQFVFECVCNSASVGSLTRTNVQGHTFSTGIIPAEFTPYRLKIVCTTVGTVTMTLTGGGVTATATLNVPQFTNSPGNEYLSQNGYGALNFNGASGAPCAAGTQLVATGFPVGFNGTHTIVAVYSGGGWANFLLAGTVGQSLANPSTLTCNPSLFPLLAIGNSSQTGAVAGQNGLLVDFVSFVWNPGVGNGTGKSNITKARYW